MIHVKRCFLFVVLFAFSSILQAQSLELVSTSQTDGHSSSIFRLGDSSVLLQEEVVRYRDNGRQVSGFLAYGISPDQSMLGFLRNTAEGSRALLLDSRSDTLVTYDPSDLESSDPSLAIYPFGGGRSVVRQNIGRFTLYDPLGTRQAEFSSVTGSEGGESVSRLASGERGQTLVLYNPKVKSNGKMGSRAHLPLPDGRLETFYADASRTIESLKVTGGGQFIGLLTAEEGTDRQLLVYDRFGNELASMRFEDAITGFSLSGRARSLVVYSDRRALVYDLITGEKKGSTSFRSNVVYANYFDADNLLLALTGNPSRDGRKINEVEVHAIHLEQRAITSTEWSGSLGMHPRIPLRLERTDTYHYLLQGTSNELRMRANF